MANTNFHHLISHELMIQLKHHLQTDDDRTIFDVFMQNDIQHVSQAIRHTQTRHVIAQYMTLRFGPRGEQSVYDFQLSKEVKYLLDIHGLYMVLRQLRFQLETLHPERIHPAVISINSDLLLWLPAQKLIRKVLRFDKRTFSLLVLCLQINTSNENTDLMAKIITNIQNRGAKVWFDFNQNYLDNSLLKLITPSAFKLTFDTNQYPLSAHSKHFILACNRKNIPWVIGRISSEAQLEIHRRLGASFYFGYLSDIPIRMSNRNFTLATQRLDEDLQT